jgi:hypothetical protein
MPHPSLSLAISPPLEDTAPSRIAGDKRDTDLTLDQAESHGFDCRFLNNTRRGETAADTCIVQLIGLLFGILGGFLLYH